MTTPPLTAPVKALAVLAEHFGAEAFGVRPAIAKRIGLVFIWSVRWADGDACHAVDTKYDRGALKVAVEVLEQTVCSCGRPIGFDQESGLCFWSYRDSRWRQACGTAPIEIDVEDLDDEALGARLTQVGDRLFPEAMDFVRARHNAQFRWRPLMR